MTAPSIVRLDRKLSRAAEIGKGVRLEPADLDLLASLGLFDLTHAAKSEYLRSQSQCRDARRRSIAAANTSCDGTGAPTALSAVRTTPCSSTTPNSDVIAASQRGRRKRIAPS